MQLHCLRGALLQAILDLAQNMLHKQWYCHCLRYLGTLWVKVIVANNGYFDAVAQQLIYLLWSRSLEDDLQCEFQACLYKFVAALCGAV